MSRLVRQCRVCGNSDLEFILSLGDLELTGFFPKTKDHVLGREPLELVQCAGSGAETCGLLQLRHHFDVTKLYGDHYGYRSSLNESMVQHLRGIVGNLTAVRPLTKGDVVVDIGSNDGTLLNAYPQGDWKLIGVDPAGEKFRSYYPSRVQLISEFFSANILSGLKADLVTSIAVFYDLDNPLQFMRDVWNILSEDGVWLLEQSYMPAMLQSVAYDTICHEHFEYYGLRQIKWMADRSGFKILDVDFTPTNGGSFLVIMAKRETSRYKENTALLDRTLRREAALDKASFVRFERSVKLHREAVRSFIAQAKREHKRIFGYGASTKGNVLLQYCGLTSDAIDCIAEVNEDKFGCWTPGTGIPIVPEVEARALRPDYFLVLPWHFKDNILCRERAYLQGGGTLVFPLPQLLRHSLVSTGGG